MKIDLLRIISFIIFLPLVVVAFDEVPEPEGFKMDQYRSPTPATLLGATVVNAVEAKTLHETGQVKFIDVLPSPKQPPGMKESDIWLPKKRLNIPGSDWLADVGYGVLSDELEIYFNSNLKRLSENNSQGMLFYCQVDCWMSWNAAKRALNSGYSNVYWFPGGVDEWLFEGFVLEASKAVELKH